MTARTEHLVTSGTFSLNGQTFDVDNNVWLLGDDDEVMVVDAPHDVDAIAVAVRGRTFVAFACAHAHDDHVRYAPELAERLSADVLLHPDDRLLWHLVHPQRKPHGDLRDGMRLQVRWHGRPRPAHTGPCPRRRLLVGARARRRLHQRHAVRRRSRRHAVRRSCTTILDSIRTGLFALPPRPES